MLRVLLVTTWGPDYPGGITDHSEQLVEAVTQADPGITVQPWMAHSDMAAPLDPRDFWADFTVTPLPRLVHLNYHAALHSQWTPSHLQALKDQGVKVVVTYHDTFGEYAPEEMPDGRLNQMQALYEVADAMVVHEPCKGFDRALYWRQGVQGWHNPIPFDRSKYPWPYVACPILGSSGFPSSWKHYDELCDLTREAGWALMLLAPGATVEQQNEWDRRQPRLYVRTDYLSRVEGIALLSGCDATAYLYGGSFAGTSGAIRWGMAARKPLLAFRNCRQMRDLWGVEPTPIYWVYNWENARHRLEAVPIQRVYAPMVAAAEQDSWARLGQKYADLYRSLS